MIIKRPVLAVLALSFSVLACTVQLLKPVPTVTAGPPTEAAQPTDTPTRRPIVPTEAGVKFTAEVLQAVVNVHAEPGGPVTSWIRGGDRVTVLGCAGDWCQIENPAGYVWRGCISGNEDIGCQAK